MIYPDNFEQRIGIDSVRQYIIEKCLCPLGEEKVANMSFSTDFPTIKKWLEQTGEFAQIIRNKENFPSNHFLDVRDSLQKVEKDITAWFAEEEISNLSNSLQTINSIVSFLHQAKCLIKRNIKLYILRRKVFMLRKIKERL